MAGAIVLAAALAVPAGSAFAEDYPSWDEVEAAKADVSAREAEATRITGFVDQLEAEAGRLGDAAVEAAAASSAAEAARAAAEGRAGLLRTAADAAQAEADASAARLGRIGAVLARSGGADVTLRLLFGADDDADLLVGLSRAAQLTTIYGGVAARATAARADAAALSEQADVAEAERTRLAARGGRRRGGRRGRARGGRGAGRGPAGGARHALRPAREPARPHRRARAPVPHRRAGRAGTGGP